MTVGTGTFSSHDGCRRVRAANSCAGLRWRSRERMNAEYRRHRGRNEAAVAGLGRRLRGVVEGARITGVPARVQRIDRGWSTLLTPDDEVDKVVRVRNIGADVAVGDWVVASADERAGRARARASLGVRPPGIVRGCPSRRPHDSPPTSTSCSCATPSVSRRTSAASSASSCWRSTAALDPVVLLTKADLVDDPEPARRELQEVALGVPVLVVQRPFARRPRRARRPPGAGAAPSPSSAPVVSASRRSSTGCSASSARRPRRCAATTAADTPPWPPSCCRSPVTAAG